MINVVFPHPGGPISNAPLMKVTLVESFCKCMSIIFVSRNKGCWKILSDIFWLKVESGDVMDLEVGKSKMMRVLVVIIDLVGSGVICTMVSFTSSPNTRTWNVSPCDHSFSDRVVRTYSLNRSDELWL